MGKFAKTRSRLPLDIHTLPDSCASDLAITRRNVNCRNSEGCTPLMLAAVKGKIGMCRRLIAAGANLEAQNVYGHTVCRMVCKNKKLSTAVRINILTELVNAGADLNAREQWSERCLILAIRQCNLQLVTFLTSKGATVEYDAIKVACSMAGFETTCHIPAILQFLLTKLSSLDNLEYCIGHFIETCEYWPKRLCPMIVECIAILLVGGVCANAQYLNMGDRKCFLNAAIHIDDQFTSHYIIEMLLNFGADPLLSDDDMCPLSLAASLDDLTQAKLMCKALNDTRAELPPIECPIIALLYTNCGLRVQGRLGTLVQRVNRLY